MPYSRHPGVRRVKGRSRRAPIYVSSAGRPGEFLDRTFCITIRYPKSMLFSYFSINRRFCKNPLKHWLCAQKSRFELEKNKKKSPKNRFPNILKKTSQRTSQNSTFIPIWASQNPSKRHQIFKNRQKKPSQKNS